MAQKRKTTIRRRRRPTSEVGGFIPLLFIGLGAVSVFKFEVAVLIAAGIIPTIVLALTGKGSHKSEKLQCVAFSNLAAVMTKVGDVWDYPSRMMETITDPISLLIMWGGSALGYALVYVGPFIAAMILQGLAQDKLKNVAAQKQALVEAWGHEVLGDKEEVEESKFIQRPPKR